jgi:hypothetical protein
VPRPKELLTAYLGRTALIDSNLLLLYLIGKCDPRIIPRFMRTKAYTVADFELLSKLLDRVFKTVLTTPNILTEVSNLATKLNENERRTFFDVMGTSIGVMNEQYLLSTAAVTERSYRTLGLTDAVILNLCPGILVLTDDLPLYSVISKRGYDVVNFTHLRAEAGIL